MFLGRFYHSFDDKGRLTIPVRFRDQLVPDGAYVMQGFDKNLMVLPSHTFDLLSHRVNKMSLTDPNARLLRQLLFSTADRVDVDKVGRILIPQFLREMVGAENQQRFIEQVQFAETAEEVSQVVVNLGDAGVVGAADLLNDLLAQTVNAVEKPRGV